MLHLISENIVSFAGDAIVNPLGIGPDRVVKMPGMVFSAILKNADPGLADEVFQKGSELGFCEVFSTSSYGLACSRIFHVITPFRWQDDEELSDLKRTYKQILSLAQKENIGSLCIPLLGTGANGYAKEESFSIAKEVINEEKSTLKAIEIYIDIFGLEIERERYSLYNAYEEMRYEKRHRFYEECEEEENKIQFELPKRYIQSPLCAPPQSEPFQIDMKRFPLEVGDSVGKLIDLFMAAKGGYPLSNKKRLNEDWDELKMVLQDVRDDFNDDSDDYLGGNIKYNWHKHADSKKGKKKTPGVPWGTEDPNGIWRKPGKLALFMAACSLGMNPKQCNFLFRFCGYYLSKYDVVDLAIKECYSCLDQNDGQGAAVLDVYAIFEKHSGKKALVPPKAPKKKATV